MSRFSYDEKREAVEWMIEQSRLFRSSTDPGVRQLHAIFKAIASDYRARDKQKVSMTILRFERALDHAEAKKKPIYGYEAGNLREIAELTIGAWPVLRQALEEFEQEATCESD